MNITTHSKPDRLADRLNRAIQPQDASKEFFIPALDCWLIAELIDDEAQFTAVDAAGDQSDTLNGARLHGESGTISFFHAGRASCHYSALRAGFQIRAAGESLIMQFTGRASRSGAALHAARF